MSTVLRMRNPDPARSCGTACGPCILIDMIFYLKTKTNVIVFKAFFFNLRCMFCNLSNQCRSIFLHIFIFVLQTRKYNWKNLCFNHHFCQIHRMFCHQTESWEDLMLLSKNQNKTKHYVEYTAEFRYNLKNFIQTPLKKKKAIAYLT